MGDVPIALFTRAPELGRVKTRLAQVVGEDEALAAHVALLERTLDVCTRAYARVELWVAGDSTAAPLPELLRRYRVALKAQSGEHLGDRMYGALRTHLEQGDPAIVVGSDIPEMQATHLEEAMRALKKGNDVVIGPSEDGGYWLIGLSREAPELFVDIPWGTSDVLALTRARAHDAQLRVAEVTTLWDLDSAEDWRRWQAIKRV
jgi:rSAM/selenodomain-associated transferase 1